MNILYGINSEGMGHVMRSLEIIKELEHKNEVTILAGGKAYSYLSQKKIRRLVKIPFLSFVSKNGQIKYLQTVILNLLKLPLIIWNYIFLAIRTISQKPSLIITDFEPISAYLALLLRIPLLSIDNQHIITETNIIANEMTAPMYKFFVYLMCPFPNRKIITSFFFPEVKSSNTILVGPIVRQTIRKQKKNDGKRLLVYLSLGDDNLLNILENLKIKCNVYGKTKVKSGRYVVVKKFDENNFAQDLANSRAVICNAGMTTLGEAVYLRKPLICVPLKGQTEQEINASQINASGYGLSTAHITEKTIKKFIRNYQKYKNNLENSRFSATKTISEIKKVISSLQMD